MNQVIFYIGSVSLTWHGVVMALAIAAAVTVCVLTGLGRRGMPTAVLLTAALGVPLGALGSKFVYWYCRFEQFEGFGDVLSRTGEGGHSLLGAMAGVIAAAVLSAVILRPDGGALGLLDCIAPGGAMGICIGRLAAFFSLDDKGNILVTEPEKQCSPLAFETVDAATGVSVWRFSTFFCEAAAALVIAVFCGLIYYTLCGGGENRERTGCAAMLFFAAFGATQAVLESTRYDALYLRSNGFVSLMQIVSLLLVVGVLAYFSVLAIRANGFQKYYALLWGGAAALLGLAGYMEYYVQRHADKYPICYAVMGSAMAGCFAITIHLCMTAPRSKASNK